MMKLTEVQSVQIKNLLSEMKSREKYINNVFKIGSKRRNELKQKGFNIETLIIDTQVAEHYIKLVLEGYASKRRILKLLSEKDLYEDVSLKTDDEAPLGFLIGKLRALGVDTVLARKLDRLNELRKVAIHHICDGTKDFSAFDKEVETYLVSKDFTEVFEGIGGVLTKVREEIKQLTGE